jgi:hypothetical protein
MYKLGMFANSDKHVYYHCGYEHPEIRYQTAIFMSNWTLKSLKKYTASFPTSMLTLYLRQFILVFHDVLKNMFSSKMLQQIRLRPKYRVSIG